MHLYSLYLLILEDICWIVSSGSKHTFIYDASTYLNNVIDERIAECPVQLNGLIGQDVLEKYHTGSISGNSWD